MGRDSATCGEPSQPCKSIAQAVYRVEWSGHIYLDGTGTETRPYNCNSSMERYQHPGIRIQKSLTIKGVKSTAHVFCFGGFQFQSINLKISIVLSSVMFRQTPLIFQDCKLVQVLNCTIRDTPTALKVQIDNNTSAQVDIKGSLFIANNASCVDIIASNNYNRSLKVRVSNTTFYGNGRFRSSLTKGAITIKSDKRKPSSFAKVQILCFKVIYRNNYGYFVNLNLPAATTSEVYLDVTLVDNTVSHMKRPSGKSTYNAVKSLYTSRASKVRAKFTNLKCFHNKFLRCLMIQSNETEVKIQNSSFIGQNIPTGKGGAIFLESKTHGTLGLVNSRFRRNKAKAGGALFVHSKHGTIELAITLVNFTECVAAQYGCAILVGDPKSFKFINQTATYKLIATFREVRVQNCSGVKRKFGRKSVVVNLLLFSGYVAISDSIWTNNLNSIFAALVIANAGGKTDIVISGCTFLRNAGKAVMFPAISKMAGSVIVNNTAISNQQMKTYAFFVSPKFNIKLINMLFNSNAIGLAIFSIVRMHYTFPVNIYIYNCTFLDNGDDIVVNLLDSTKIKFTLNSTIFTTRKASRKDFAISFTVQLSMKLKLSNAVIELDNNTFNSRPCNFFRLNFPGNKTLKIKRSLFREGICLHRYIPRNTYTGYEVGTGAISVITNHNKLKTPGCVEKYTNENIHPLWNYDTEVLFEDTTFEENAGLISGAVYISNGNVTFNRCIFRNNFATKRSGHIYSAYGTGQVNFNDCSFSTSLENLTVNDTAFHRSTFLYSENGGPIMFKNTSMVSSIGQRSPFAVVDISNGGYIDIDSRSTIECSIGSQLSFENNTHFVHVYNELNGSFCRVNVTVLKYSCHLCSPGFYSLQKGVSYGLNVPTSVNCLSCPFGATCIEKNIAAKPNFWGYPSSNHSPLLSFYACPEHYCQSPTESDPKKYNSCYGNRTGILCGKCASEYSENLFSTECQKKTECNNYLLWIITLLFTTGLALYLLIKPPVMSFLGRQVVWFRKRGDYQVIQELGQVDAPTDSGYLKIAFYFYQAAELLIVRSTKDLIPHELPFVFSVVDLFNFQVRTLQRVVDCPIAGLTAVTKELLLSATVFLTIAELVIMYGLHVAFNKIRHNQRPPPIHFVAAVIELLLLGYERLARTSLTLMHCVTIGSQKRLFIDAEVACWQWWQYIVLAYIIASVVPFIIVLYFGSYKLYKASISAIEFLGACVFPLPFLIYWFLKKMLTIRDSGSESTQTNAGVLEILHAPFRQPNDNDNGTIYWESVLIGRRFLLLACYAFITNTMFRMICMTAVCVIILLHHDLKNPYRDPIANKCETCSLSVLVMLAVVNITKATLISSGTSTVGPTKSYIIGFNWFEICALAFLPTMLSIFVVLAILSQLVRLTMAAGKLIYRYVR